jgi:hypothetical protein
LLDAVRGLELLTEGDQAIVMTAFDNAAREQAPFLLPFDDADDATREQAFFLHLHELANPPNQT